MHCMSPYICFDEGMHSCQVAVHTTDACMKNDPNHATCHNIMCSIGKSKWGNFRSSTQLKTKLPIVSPHAFKSHLSVRSRIHTGTWPLLSGRMRTQQKARFHTTSQTSKLYHATHTLLNADMSDIYEYWCQNTTNRHATPTQWAGSTATRVLRWTIPLHMVTLKILYQVKRT